MNLHLEVDELLGSTVRLHYVHGETRAVGHVIAYADRPTVVVEYPDGSRESWMADLTEVVTCELLCCNVAGHHRPSTPGCSSSPLLWNGDQA